MPRRSTCLSKGLIDEGEEETRIDIEFTNPEEDVIETEELKSIDFNTAMSSIGEDELLTIVPNSNEFNEKVPSVESDEQSIQVNESMINEDSLKMAPQKQPLTKSVIAKLRSARKETSTSSEEHIVNLSDDQTISLMPSGQPKRILRPRVLKAETTDTIKINFHSKFALKVQKRKATLPTKNEKKLKMARVEVDDDDDAVQVLRTRSSPIQLYQAIKHFEREQRRAVVEMGLKSLLHLRIDSIPARLGFYVVDQFDEEKMVLKLPAGELKITKDSVERILGFPTGDIRITQKRTNSNDEVVRRWRSQFPPKKRNSSFNNRGTYSSMQML